MLSSSSIKALGIQVVLILAATLLGIIAAGKLVEDSLLKTALKKETDYFWAQRKTNANHPTPDTMNLQGYLVDLNNDTATHPYAHLPLGYHRETQEDITRLTYVSQQENLHLTLILDESRVLQLSLYFGLLPLGIVLFILYGSFWLFRTLLKKQMSPIVQLAKQVNTMEIDENFNEKLKVPLLLGVANDDFYVIHDTLLHLNARLRRFIDREREFTRNASHELRTPLSVIKGSSEYLLRFSTLDEKSREIVNRILLNSNKMEALIQLLLQLSREDETIKGDHRTHVNQIINNLVNDISDALPQEKLDSVTLSIEEEAPELISHIPEHFISMIISNLVSNAIKYTDQGKIVIKINPKSISIEDTGMGISDKDLQNIFSPFYRSDKVRNNTAMNESSYGLGLAIVKKLCDKFQIKIAVRSTLGKGTAFFLDFSATQA